MQIYVGNLTFTATVDDVRQLFEPYGDVERVNLPEDRETGRPRGFGFVEMPNATEARAAIAGLNGKDLGGRSLMVNEARPREERGGPRRGPRWYALCVHLGISVALSPSLRADHLPPSLAISVSCASMPLPCTSTLPSGVGRWGCVRTVAS